ncbi:alpha-galactosidase, partial [Micromonospora sp. DH15]|nr:alpha-galactosidase [Micromonospora sp. DH15]
MRRTASRRRWVTALAAGFLLVGAAVGLYAPAGQALENGVARTPPMGWNSWTPGGCNSHEPWLRQMAAAIVRR